MLSQEAVSGSRGSRRPLAVIAPQGFRCPRRHFLALLHDVLILHKYHVKNHGCKAKPVRLTGGLVHSATANLEFCAIHNRVVVHANATSKVVNETVLSARSFE